MTKEISSLELRSKFGEIMDRVRYEREPYIVKKNGRAMIVLIDIDAYEASRSQFEEEKFIEEYSEARIAEFLSRDHVGGETRKKISKSAGRE
jgi:prevent-host-death family protein